MSSKEDLAASTGQKKREMSDAHLKELKKLEQSNAKPGAGELNMSPGAIDSILRNVDRDRRTGRFLLGLCFLLCLITVPTAVTTYHLATREPVVLGFLMNAEGEFMEVHAVGDPVVTHEQAANFAGRKIIDLNNFAFNNIQRHFNGLHQHFAPEAWNNYFRNAQDTGLIEKVRAGNLVLMSTPISAPEVIEVFNNPRAGGAREFVVHMRFLRDLRGGSTHAERTQMEAVMRLREVPRHESIHGLKIVSYLERGG